LRTLGGSALPAIVETPSGRPPSGQDAEGAPGLSQTQLTSILKHYWGWSAAIAVLGLALTAGVVLLQGSIYTAVATLIISPENKDPLAGETLPLQLLGAYVVTQAELMTSPVVLLPVVDKLNLTSDPDYSGGFRGDRAGLRDYVQKRLSYSLQVEIGKGGELLYISATARTAARAAQVANAIAEAYLTEERARINGPASERAQRYSEQLRELRAKVAVAQDNITAFRDRNHLTGDISPTADTESQALAELEKRFLDAQNARRATEAGAAQSAVSGEVAVSSKLIEGLTEKLANLQAQAAQLRSTLGPEHPKLLDLEFQIAATRQALVTQSKTLSRGTTAGVSGATELERSFKQAVDQQREKVWEIRKLQDEGSKIELELQSAQAVYKRALDGYDQIMFASSGNHTNATFVNRAVPPAQTASHRMKKVLMGTVMALGLALVGPLFYELAFNRRLRCRDDLERSFRVAVLAEIGPYDNRGRMMQARLA
jgi:succinoglycan biosynthesis transport protein ExoP